MSSIIGSLALCGYASYRWSTSKGVMDSGKSIVNDVYGAASGLYSLSSAATTLISSMFSAATVAGENYKQCLNAAKERSPTITLIPNVSIFGLNLLSGWEVSSPAPAIHEAACEVYRGQSLIYGTAAIGGTALALYMLYKLIPCAKALFNGICKVKQVISKKEETPAKQDFIKEERFFNTLINEYELSVEGFSVDPSQGLIAEMTTEMSLEKLSKDLEALNAELVEIVDEGDNVIALEIARNGYTIEVTASI